ncbi:MAG: hypothetical protein GC159_11200 [Phycisphaera sp.]|nr:hypothetical protein [Phycisphaera sp.]
MADELDTTTAASATPAPPATTAVRPPRRWVWPAIVLGLLASHVTLCVSVMAIANSDPSVAIVDDYHDKALHWDDHMAEVRRSAALGWSAEATVGDTRDALSRRTLTLTLRDASGAPIEHAAVEAVAFADVRANDRLTLTLHATSDPGVYAVPLDARRAGLWELRVTARRGADTFTTSLQLSIN